MKKKSKQDLEHCVIVSSQFADRFPNLNRYYRNGMSDKNIAFDCASLKIVPPFLEIAALSQKLPYKLPHLDIWIPLSEIQAVIFDTIDKDNIGFAQRPQDNNDQDQEDHSS
ncbi:MAG: hypothetical protein EPN88_10815 [Bacteroidetes bacterium]|nr:MAG: hypothetical protein EPN88_10815 [Bacteroidota bacterium]